MKAGSALITMLFVWWRGDGGVHSVERGRSAGLGLLVLRKDDRLAGGTVIWSHA